MQEDIKLYIDKYEKILEIFKSAREICLEIEEIQNELLKKYEVEKVIEAIRESEKAKIINDEIEKYQNILSKYI